MKRSMRTALAAAVLAAMAAQPQAAVAQVPPASELGVAAPGVKAWEFSHDEMSAGPDELVIDPAGERLFTTETLTVDSINDDLDFGVIAQDADDGTILWEASYGHSFRQWDIPVALDVSHDGALVYVTGYSAASRYSTDIATVAFHADSGELAWVARYDEGHDSQQFTTRDTVADVTAGPNGVVYVTGQGSRPMAGEPAAMTTVAYDGTTGEQLWVNHYHRGTWAMGRTVEVSPDGSRVFVTGSDFVDSFSDILAVSIDAVTGELLWASSYNGVGDADDIASDMQVSPDGSTLYIGGETYGGAPTGNDFVAIAYDTATGEQRWVNSYAPPFHASETLTDMAVSPDGRSVYLAGWAESGPETPAGGGRSGRDWTVVAHEAATGTPRWTYRYTSVGRHGEGANSLVVSPDSTRVYAAGINTSLPSQYNEYRTVAFDAVAGREIWVAHHRARVHASSLATAAALHPDGKRLYVTGVEDADAIDEVTTTIAYCTTPLQLGGGCL